MSDGLKKRWKFGLIGCGAIAEKHVNALQRLDRDCVVGAYDLSHESREKFEKEFGIPTFETVEEMVLKVNPDIFNVLTPSGSHAQTVLDLVHFNKHFIVEKPLSLKLSDSDKLLEACDDAGIKIFVVKQNRFNPPIQKLREALVKGRFGKLVMGTVRVRWSRPQSYYDQKPWRGTWALDGGVLTNQASHHIDMLMWMMGPVESVVAMTATRLATIEAEDTGIALLKFKSGALGVIEATTATRPKDLEGSISILGEHGTVEVGGFFMNDLKTWAFSNTDEMDETVWASATVPTEPGWSHTEFFKDVLSSLDQGRRGLIDGIEGRKSIELINAIYESAETGRSIPLQFVPSRSRLGEIVV